MPRLMKTAILGGVLLTLVACNATTPQLMNLRNDEDGPDEFAVLPTQPLQIPDNVTALPSPTPGARSLADPDPEAAAIAALGGNVERGVSGGDIVTYASRFGVSADIRSVLAAEDEVFRQRNDGRILERMFGTTIYFEAYRRQSLDGYREWERLRRSGVRTPSAPPEQ